MPFPGFMNYFHRGPPPVPPSAPQGLAQARACYSEGSLSTLGAAGAGAGTVYLAFLYLKSKGLKSTVEPNVEYPKVYIEVPQPEFRPHHQTLLYPLEKEDVCPTINHFGDIMDAAHPSSTFKPLESLAMYPSEKIYLPDTCPQPDDRNFGLIADRYSKSREATSQKLQFFGQLAHLFSEMKTYLLVKILMLWMFTKHVVKTQWVALITLVILLCRELYPRYPRYHWKDSKKDEDPSTDNHENEVLSMDSSKDVDPSTDSQKPNDSINDRVDAIKMAITTDVQQHFDAISNDIDKRFGIFSASINNQIDKFGDSLKSLLSGQETLSAGLNERREKVAKDFDEEISSIKSEMANFVDLMGQIQANTESTLDTLSDSVKEATSENESLVRSEISKQLKDTSEESVQASIAKLVAEAIQRKTAALEAEIASLKEQLPDKKAVDDIRGRLGKVETALEAKRKKDKEAYENISKLFITDYSLQTGFRNRMVQVAPGDGDGARDALAEAQQIFLNNPARFNPVEAVPNPVPPKSQRLSQAVVSNNKQTVTNLPNNFQGFPQAVANNNMPTFSYHGNTSQGFPTAVANNNRSTFLNFGKTVQGAPTIGANTHRSTMSNIPQAPRAHEKTRPFYMATSKHAPSDVDVRSGPHPVPPKPEGPPPGSQRSQRSFKKKPTGRTPLEPNAPYPLIVNGSDGPQLEASKPEGPSPACHGSQQSTGSTRKQLKALSAEAAEFTPGSPNTQKPDTPVRPQQGSAIIPGSASQHPGTS